MTVKIKDRLEINVSKSYWILEDGEFRRDIILSQVETMCRGFETPTEKRGLHVGNIKKM